MPGIGTSGLRERVSRSGSTVCFGADVVRIIAGGAGYALMQERARVPVE
jgi:hypothetical protein